MTTNSTIASKTLKQLRAAAKARGLKGYSKLTKAQLARKLAQAAPAAAASSNRARTARTRKKSLPAAKVAMARPAVSPVQTKTPESPAQSSHSEAPPAAVDFTPSPEWVERAKYTSRPNGHTAFTPNADLGEDIDRLPELTQPVVCLLPQKPGVLHAYWAIPPGEITATGDFKLRLGRSIDKTTTVIEEIPVRVNRGSWYFHIPEQTGTPDLLVELGYYRDGAFVVARGRSVAHLPSFYASTRTDDRWWVSEAEFQQMYLRAGGFMAAAQTYGFVGAGSSSIDLATRDK